MSAESTFKQLCEFGIAQDIAREASKRYQHNVAAAVDWCFGAGQDFKPDQEMSRELPMYASTTDTSTASAQHIEHRDHRDARSPHSSTTPLVRSGSPSNAPALPPRRLPPTPGPKLGSKNPFNTESGLLAVPLAPVPSAVGIEAVSQNPSVSVSNDDEDAELQRAIQLSQQDLPPSGNGTQVAGGNESTEVEMADGHTGDARTERERSVRATAPPPSPEPDGETLKPLFGPTNKQEQGSTALVSAGHYNNPIDITNNEDEDLKRAIQDSLMTASFHSQSGPISQRPIAVPRKEGAPLIFLSESSESTYAANFLQAVHAVPRLRQVIMQSIVEGVEPWKYASQLRDLQRLYALADTEEVSFIEVDDLLKEMRDGTIPTQLPPTWPVTNMFNIIDQLYNAIMTSTKSQKAMTGEIWDRPDLLLHTHLEPPLVPAPTFVNVERQTGVKSDMLSQLANVFWRGNMETSSLVPASSSSPESIVEFGDTLGVLVKWTYGAERDMWNMQERIVLDRFAKENRAWSTLIRAQQAVAQGTIRRLKERIEVLSEYKGRNIHDSLETLINHYDPSSPFNTTNESSDAVKSSTRLELQERLKKTLESLKAKTAELEKEVLQEEEFAGDKMFETDDPEKNKQVFTLHAVLMHDGAVVAGRHLYMYVKTDEGRWWKIQDHEVEETAFETIAADRTGLFMDGGPYMLLYARDGPRPQSLTSPTPAPIPAPAVDASQIPTSPPAPEPIPVPLHPGDINIASTTKEFSLVPDASLQSSSAGGLVELPAYVQNSPFTSTSTGVGTATSKSFNIDSSRSGGDGVSASEAGGGAVKEDKEGREDTEMESQR